MSTSLVEPTKYTFLEEISLSPIFFTSLFSLFTVTESFPTLSKGHARTPSTTQCLKRSTRSIRAITDSRFIQKRKNWKARKGISDAETGHGRDIHGEMQ